MTAYLLFVREKAFSDYLSRKYMSSKRRHIKSERKIDPKWGKKKEREIQERFIVHAFLHLPSSCARCVISLFLSQFSLSCYPSLGDFVRPSSSLTSNLGVVADGGGGRVRMVVAMVGG